MQNYVLPSHAAQCLGVAAGQLNLPRCGDGVSADALWRSPQYAAVMSEQQAIARQFVERRHEVNLQYQPPTPQEVKLDRKRERAKGRRAAAKI
jgi:hypothetical protein